MKVIHTIAGTRLDHGGTSRSVPALCEAIQRGGMEVHFVTTRPRDQNIPFNVPRAPVESHLIPESQLFGRLSLGTRFEKSLSAIQMESRGSGDVPKRDLLIHDHGIWLAPNHAVATYARKNTIRRIVSPRGMLSSWAINRSRWKKRLAWWAYQFADLQNATAFHVTAKAEAEEVRSLGFTQPIAIISNGVTFPDRPYYRKDTSGIRRMLFLSRIHPKKGLIELVRAWKAANVGADWNLIIAGPDECGHQQQVEKEVRELGLTGSIKFPGAIDDAVKWQSYADAEVFILPSFSENFGLVIAEALSAGLPVITTTGTPWNDLPNRGCGWWVNPIATELSEAIATATRLSPMQLSEMGQVGSEWARRSFTWDAISHQMISFYEWIHGSSARPDFIDVSAKR